MFVSELRDKPLTLIKYFIIMCTATKNQLELLRKFAYFSTNYDINFIEKAWVDTPWLAKHLQGKFSICVERSPSGGGRMVDFYQMLDQGNQKILTNYILNNYEG